MSQHLYDKAVKYVAIHTNLTDKQRRDLTERDALYVYEKLLSLKDVGHYVPQDYLDAAYYMITFAEVLYYQ